MLALAEFLAAQQERRCRTDAEHIREEERKEDEEEMEVINGKDGEMELSYESELALEEGRIGSLIEAFPE